MSTLVEHSRPTTAATTKQESVKIARRLVHFGYPRGHWAHVTCVEPVVIVQLTEWLSCTKHGRAIRRHSYSWNHHWKLTTPNIK
jgi:hypothetical protein